MKRNLATDVEALLLGPRAIQIALDRADKLALEGDAVGSELWRGKALAFQEYFESNEAEDKRKYGKNPNDVKLYAGFSGLKIEESVTIVSGLRLTSTYAHVMSPFIMAFSQAEFGRPHPGPWKSASGGSYSDIHVQAVLDDEVRVGKFDRLNSIWFLATLLRLQVSSEISVPVVSDTTFAEVPNGHEPVLWPVELSSSKQLALVPSAYANANELEWIVSNIQMGALMMQGEVFSLAMQTLDQAWFAKTHSTKLLLLWSALEALFRPGERDITKRLAKMIATYLTDDPRIRDRSYQEIKELYRVRGEMVHAARAPGAEPTSRTGEIARQVFIRAIEHGQVPDQDRLQLAWSERRPY